MKALWFFVVEPKLKQQKKTTRKIHKTNVSTAIKTIYKIKTVNNLIFNLNAFKWLKAYQQKKKLYKGAKILNLNLI